MKKIIASLAMIALAIAGVTSATIAYFSNVEVREGNTFAMGTVEVTQDDGWGLPFMFTNMIPGEQRESAIITVRNTGSIPIDLYFGERATSGDGDFKGVVDYAVNEVTCWDGNHVYQWIGWQDVVSLFSTWNKVGENIPASEHRCYKIYIKPDAGMGNNFQGRQAITDVILYAVQHGALAPSGQPWNWSE
ncbi:SipW-dependent-type signal peptide-containing protein [Candidatus Woesebacteria bacterium]|nr:SipW-dependent-type signal peptide-containing protein [Candidatus Woesebacteria bacterium]